MLPNVTLERIFTRNIPWCGMVVIKAWSWQWKVSGFCGLFLKRRRSIGLQKHVRWAYYSKFFKVQHFQPCHSRAAPTFSLISIQELSASQSHSFQFGVDTFHTCMPKKQSWLITAVPKSVGFLLSFWHWPGYSSLCEYTADLLLLNALELMTISPSLHK